MAALLDVKNLGISFGGLRAVDSFDLSIQEKQLYGLIGPNGAGKTTVFNLLTGVYKPDTGKVILKDHLEHCIVEAVENHDHATIEAHTVIVNATPLGTFPRVDTCPPLPYEWLGDRHLLFDLVYNPAETLFLQKGKARGCDTVNGEQMLIGQAEAAWTIWNEEDDCPSVRG